MTIFRESVFVGTQEITIETGRMARQAGGSVVVQYGESQVLCMATAGRVKPLPFFPLVCDYVENQWAAGAIPGGYFRREAKPSSKATLTSRLIDRPCRPLFPEDFKNETQLIAWVISADRINDTDIHGITGCSAALMISDVPWDGPVAGVRVGRVAGEFVANPTFEQRENSDIDLVMAVTPDAIVMVEGLADVVPEAIMIDALDFGRESVQDLLKLQLTMAKALGKEKMTFPVPEKNTKALKAVDKAFHKRILEAVTVKDKIARYKGLDALKDEVVAAFADDFPDQEGDIKEAFGDLKKNIVRSMVLKESVRLDGRALDEVRDITVEVGLLPKSHGSCLFTRGETQALASVTLGTEKAAQRLDTLEGDLRKSFMLHYNFPPFCVGEVRMMRGTSRREVGHGFLAERALTAGLPDQESEFPYTIRVVSDVLESNGSSSMASVCGGSLAMMDAGVPLKHATAGIAMGLIKEGDDVAILSDILGDEDHLGDMDFKVCGTADGITAFQLDTKIKGLSRDTMVDALLQAQKGRQHILEIMDRVLDQARHDLSPNAPRITHIKIPVSAIGAVIGQGGSTIRSIQEATGAQINISDDGTVGIAASCGVAAKQAIEIIEGLTATPEIGETYLGTVTKIASNDRGEFGAFIEILPGTEGLLHVSELTEGHVDRVSDILAEGDECMVKVIGLDPRSGKIKLSRKSALTEKKRPVAPAAE
jgi:polyribonucleotide nucleotidyltransferase